MIKADRLYAIIESSTNDLRELAAIAEGDPASFYRGANFNDADLRGQNLCGFNLNAATFERARIDRKTKVDKQFRKSAGLQRITLSLGPRKLINETLALARIQIEKPADQHIGDLIEEGLHKQPIEQGRYSLRFAKAAKELLRLEISDKWVESKKISEIFRQDLLYLKDNVTWKNFQVNIGNNEINSHTVIAMNKKDQLKASVTPQAYALLLARASNEISLEAIASQTLFVHLARLVNVPAHRQRVHVS